MAILDASTTVSIAHTRNYSDATTGDIVLNWAQWGLFDSFKTCNDNEKKEVIGRVAQFLGQRDTVIIPERNDLLRLHGVGQHTEY